MNAHFHTPSFGDEVFDLSEIDSNKNTTSVHQQQNLLSKRMRGSMDNSMDEYHSANDESFVASSQNSSIIASPTPTATATAAARKQLSPSADSNEPAKPLSAYALFFRDTVSAIKQQNPNCSFQEISRIVASMWEALDPTHKNVYNKKNEMAKNEYIKQMRIYRQQQLEQQQQQQQQEHLNAQVSVHTKPAVFTITRGDSDSDGQTYHTPVNSSPPQQQQTQQQSHYQQQFEQQQQTYNNNHQQQASQIQQQPQQQQTNTYSTDTQSVPPVQQNQLLTEAGSVQKCIRDHCTKRAIINPDWEDEYCSNECVVIHCRNVFNSWVQANLDGRSQ